VYEIVYDVGSGDFLSPMVRILFGFIFGIVCIPAALFYWYSKAGIPVAVTDQPLPYERHLTGKALHDRIDKEMVQRPPLQPDEETLVEGARIYGQKCAVCHGLHGKPSAIGQNMYPSAPPLWEKHSDSKVVGVSDDLPGETYWKIANGIRLTGMPEFKTELTDTQIWQVSLLLANADKPLPPDALVILRGDPPKEHAKAPSESVPSSTILDE
jgi:thiosulfate dehydrogenase